MDDRGNDGEGEPLRVLLALHELEVSTCVIRVTLGCASHKLLAMPIADRHATETLKDHL